MRSPSAAVRYAVSILKHEAKAIQSIAPRIDKSFDQAVELCRCASDGRIVVSGMGKSGIIAQKISSTLASVSLPSWFLHPAEVTHGDIGRVTPKDVCILISNSGETSEILLLASILKKHNIKIIAITSKSDSSLAKLADVILETGILEEAGNIKMIPTASTTAVMALGDALALSIVGENFTVADYYRTHPGGNIGRRLTKVDELMRKGEDCPIVTEDATILETIMAITKAAAGAAIVVTRDGEISGIFTDGDLRRAVEANDIQGPIAKRMTAGPMTIGSGSLVEDAMAIFNQHLIGELPVIGIGNKPLGMLTIKDIIAGPAYNLPKPANQ